jgi:hypothetical protein
MAQRIRIRWVPETRRQLRILSAHRELSATDLIIELDRARVSECSA